MNWKIRGKLDSTSRLVHKKDGKFGQRELQYHIDFPKEVLGRSNVTIGDYTIPIFAWQIQLKRLLLPFIVKSFIPTILLVVVSWTSFLIAPECVPGRAGVLVTLLLVLSTVSLHELDESPSEKGITPLLIWNHICLIMICLALLEYSGILYAMRFSLVRKYQRKGVGMKTRIKKPNLERTQMGKKNKIVSSDHTPFEKIDPKRCIKHCNDISSYTEKAHIIDRYSLYLFPVVFFTVTILYVVYFGVSDE